MKNIPKLCAWVGLALVILTAVLRVPGGLGFSARGVIEFTQMILLLGICFGVANTCEKK